jgi:aldose 1-epimerase
MTRTVVAFAILAALAAPVRAQRYSARREGDVVRLQDAASRTTVSIVPSVGNMVVEMKVNGHDVLRWPFATIEEFKAKPAMSGIPFVGPWANRLDEQAFYANGKKYAFDMALGNVRGTIPIHGFLTTASQWEVVEATADANSAWLTSRLEVHRQPTWMKQWPFPHTIELTHRLQGGVLEVHTAISNLAAEPMPVAIGFHPYFRLTDSPRGEWKIAVGARRRWVLEPNKVPAGVTEGIEQLFPNPRAARLDEYNLDDVFSDLVRDADGRATMSVVGKTQRLDVLIGRNYKSVVIWAPHPANVGRGSQALGSSAPTGQSQNQDRNFICFEPMAAITNALNLAHRGRYDELQYIPPGGTWRESFWVRPNGF